MMREMPADRHQVLLHLHVWGLRADLRLDRLRSDVRFEELLGRMAFSH